MKKYRWEVQGRSPYMFLAMVVNRPDSRSYDGTFMTITSLKQCSFLLYVEPIERAIRRAKFRLIQDLREQRRHTRNLAALNKLAQRC